MAVICLRIILTTTHWTNSILFFDLGRNWDQSIQQRKRKHCLGCFPDAWLSRVSILNAFILGHCICSIVNLAVISMSKIAANHNFSSCKLNICLHMHAFVLCWKGCLECQYQIVLAWMLKWESDFLYWCYMNQQNHFYFTLPCSSNLLYG